MRSCHANRSTSMLGCALAILLAAPSHAITLSWLNAVSGVTNDSTKWSPTQVPSSSDVLYWNVPGTYTVTFSGTPISTWLAADDGNVTLLPLGHSTGSIFVGTAAGRSASMTISQAAQSTAVTLASSGNLFVGSTAGATGSLTVRNALTSLSLTSPAAIAEIGRSGGTGDLHVVTGGSFTTSGQLSVPGAGGGVGTLSVEGRGDAYHANLNVLSGPTQVHVGDAAGATGSVLVYNGGVMSLHQDLRVGTAAGGTGSVTVQLADNADSARVQLTGNLWLAHNNNASAAGTGSLSVLAGGTVDVSGATWTFDDQPGSLGTLTVEDGARFATHDLHVGNPASELLLHGGTFQVTGGALDLTGDPLLISSATGSPVVELLAGSTCALNSATVPALEVGGTASGRLNVRDGSSLVVHDRAAWVGGSAGGNGTLEVSAGGTLATDLDLVVGRQGHGFLHVTDGGQATLAGLNVSSQPGGSGFVTLDGSGSDAHVTGQCVLSGVLAGGSGSASSCDVTLGGRLWLDNAANPGRVWPGGTLSCQAAGELHLAGSLPVQGTLSLLDGIATGGQVALDGGGQITGRGDVQSRVTCTDTLGIITASGPLLLGNASLPVGYRMLGRLDVGAGDVTLRSSGAADMGTVLMSDGTLHLNGATNTLPVGRYLKGSGTITGPLTNSGSIYSSGTGLTFAGLLLGGGQACQGAPFHFLSGGGFQGAGWIKAGVDLDPGAIVVATGDLKLGNVPGPVYLTLDGSIFAGNHVVTLSSVYAAVVGGDIGLGGGTLASTGEIFDVVAPLGQLWGSGLVDADVTCSGRLDPGAPQPTPAAGTLTLNSLVMQASGSVRVDLGNHALAESDRLVVTGAATLTGTLDVGLLASYSAAVGDSFLVLDCGTRTGTFSALTCYGQSAAGLFDVHYDGNQVWLVALAPVALGVPASPPAPVTGLRLAPGGSPGASPWFVLELPESGGVQLEAFDVNGRRLATLYRGELGAGRHHFDLPSGLPAGAVFARALIGSGTAARSCGARVLVVR